MAKKTMAHVCKRMKEGLCTESEWQQAGESPVNVTFRDGCDAAAENNTLFKGDFSCYVLH